MLCEGVTYSNWPWGKQTCNLKFGSWAHDSHSYDLQFYDDQAKTLKTKKESLTQRLKPKTLPTAAVHKMQNEIPLRLRWTCANLGNITSSRSYDRLQQGSLRSKNIIQITSDNPEELSGKKSELYHKVRLLSLSICQPELPLQVNKFTF